MTEARFVSAHELSLHNLQDASVTTCMANKVIIAVGARPHHLMPERCLEGTDMDCIVTADTI